MIYLYIFEIIILIFYAAIGVHYVTDHFFDFFEKKIKAKRNKD